MNLVGGKTKDTTRMQIINPSFMLISEEKYTKVMLRSYSTLSN